MHSLFTMLVLYEKLKPIWIKWNIIYRFQCLSSSSFLSGWQMLSLVNDCSIWTRTTAQLTCPLALRQDDLSCVALTTLLARPPASYIVSNVKSTDIAAALLPCFCWQCPLYPGLVASVAAVASCLSTHSFFGWLMLSK